MKFEDMCAAWRERIVYLARGRRFIDKTTRRTRHGIRSIEPILVSMFPNEPHIERLARSFLQDRMFDTVEHEDYFPGEGFIVERGEARFANTWMGWGEKDGDIGPFRDFCASLFRRSRLDGERLLNMVAWRAQNPTEHIAYGAIVSGDDSDAALFLAALEAAFSPYTVRMGVVQLKNTHRTWMRDTSLVTIASANQAMQMRAFREALQQVISSPIENQNSNSQALAFKAHRNQFFCCISVASGVDIYVPVGSNFYIVSSERVPPELSSNLREFLDNGGGKIITKFLLDRDLSKFVMPHKAPETVASSIAYQEQMTPFERLAYEMRELPVNRVALWISEALEWANAVLDKAARGMLVSAADRARAEQVVATLPDVTIRPWYTAEEISLLFPHVPSSRNEKHLRAASVSKELRLAGLPYLIPTDNQKGFMRGGTYKHYFIVSDHEKWLEPLSQAQFDEEWPKFPNYRAYVEAFNAGSASA